MGQTDGICVIEGCGKQRFRRGYCAMHYSRILRHGTPDDLQLLRERVWRRVRVIPDCCWEIEVQGDHPGRHVQIRVEGKPVPAHRWIYEQLVGLIPEGLVLDHLCKNPPCVNPAHLEPVTLGVNTLRGDSPWAKNARKTECVNGHALAGDNLILWRGMRQCRQCHIDWKRRNRAKRRVAV